MTAALLLCLTPLSALATTAAGVTPMVISSFQHPHYADPVVPTGSRVDDGYFDGAVLVGDSISEPFSIHGVVPELEVLPVIGISARTAATNKLFEHDDEICTLAEKLVAMQPRIVYLWLGSNGVDTKAADQVIEDYDHLLNILIAELPETLFYLVELSPVKHSAVEKYRGYTNERVDAFNEGLYEVAKRHGVYLLRINSLLKNEDGVLHSDFGAGDGIHLRSAAYSVLADYLYTHTIPLEGH